MQEGPSIIILKELLQPFKNKKVMDAKGNAAIDMPYLINKKVVDFKSHGKHFLICFDELTLRVHFLLFGSYSIDTQTKTEKSIRLSLQFKNGVVYFYTCAIKELDKKPDETYDWTSDIMNDKWNAGKALKKIKDQPNEMVCDVLLDQNIFAGVGNIIKNEVLYRIKMHPQSMVAHVPLTQLKLLIKEAHNYSFDFLKWKKEDVLRKNWLAYKKKICTRCNLPIIKTDTGKKHRSSYFCINCQNLYK